MTDRDHFAAAALTGLLIAGDDGSFSEDSYARAAYRWADVMLRERDRTNHDAAPAAIAVSTDDRTDKAAPSQCRDRPGGTPVTEPMTKEKRAEVSDGSEPVAWAVVYPNDEVAVIAFKRRDADERASASDRIVPLYRQTQATLTDAEREAIERLACACETSAFLRDPVMAATLRRLTARLAP